MYVLQGKRQGNRSEVSGAYNWSETSKVWPSCHGLQTLRLCSIRLLLTESMQKGCTGGKRLAAEADTVFTGLKA